MVTPKTRYGVIGDPIAHSLSPFIMCKAFDRFGIDASYTAERVTPGELPEFVRRMRERGYKGVNITYPHKEAVLPLAGEETAAVRAIGASNILALDDGVIVAHNTDGGGASLALQQVAGITLSGKRACILGCGGAGRAAAHGLLSAGADAVAFAVRDTSRCKKSIEKLREAFPKAGIGCYDSRTAPDADILINATPLGMMGFGATTPFEEHAMIGANHVVFDFVYHPKETSLIGAATRCGARTLNGLALLVAQAHLGFRLWTGKEFSIGEMYQAVNSHETENK